MTRLHFFILIIYHVTGLVLWLAGLPPPSVHLSCLSRPVASELFLLMVPFLALPDGAPNLSLYFLALPPSERVFSAPPLPCLASSAWWLCPWVERTGSLPPSPLFLPLPRSLSLSLSLSLTLSFLSRQDIIVFTFCWDFLLCFLFSMREERCLRSLLPQSPTSAASPSIGFGKGLRFQRLLLVTEKWTKKETEKKR